MLSVSSSIKIEEDKSTLGYN